ncbi:hypothetical protein NX059_000683 [Plenodomus lindquistii]|nr:hypothetical protein NX059_000683 [Plenodomus lindquistii]
MGNAFSSTNAGNWKSDVRYAMESGAFCVICGGPFDIEGDVYNIDPKDPRFAWLFQFRLLGHVSDVPVAKVASEKATAKNDTEVEDIFLSERAWFRMSGTQHFHVPSQDTLGDVWFNTPSYTQDAGNLFPLHEACISISCKVIESLQFKHTERKPEPELAVLSQLLNARFRDRHANSNVPDEMRNDLFNLCGVSDHFGPRSVLAMTRLEWWGGEYDRFYTNPLDEAKTSPLALSILQNSPRMKLEQYHTWDPCREPTTLERVPPELMDLICVDLPARSVVALHRTSKTLAAKTPMDNVFWRDSLCNGSLHPHLWDLDAKWIERHLQESRFSSPDPDAAFDWRCAAQNLSIHYLAKGYGYGISSRKR